MHFNILLYLLSAVYYSVSHTLQYRVIHKSVKHFKNSQQIDYSTDHGISYADRERNSPSFFNIQGVPGGKDLTSGECSLGQTIPI